jgi:hypothetical protein
MEAKNNTTMTIDERLSSSDWDTMIAKRVISRRRRKTFAVITGITGFAAAASLAIALTFGLPQNNTDVSVSSFMTAQLEGSVDDAKLTSAIDMDFFAFDE